jgi:hypothetical protein
MEKAKQTKKAGMSNGVRVASGLSNPNTKHAVEARSIALASSFVRSFAMVWRCGGGWLGALSGGVREWGMRYVEAGSLFRQREQRNA